MHFEFDVGFEVEVKVEVEVWFGIELHVEAGNEIDV